MNNTFEITQCRICKSKELHKVLDLGNHPLANALTVEKQPSNGKFPLELIFCGECKLSQLGLNVNSNLLFDEYVWVTGTSLVAQNEAKRWAEFIKKIFPPAKETLVYEIASNDDTFLRPLSEFGYTTIGIDPASNLANYHKKSSIIHEYDYFTNDFALKLKEKYGTGRLIIARNVLAHVPNPVDFILGIKNLLSNDGVAIIEFHYAGNILSGLQYDSIYHEHISYFSFESFKKLLKGTDLEVWRVEKGPISGGSLIVFVKKSLNKLIETQSTNIDQVVSNELETKVNEEQSWLNFGKKSLDHMEKFENFLETKRDLNINLIFFGASARSSTLLNCLTLDLDWTLGFIDSNPLKWSLFSPGKALPINSINSFKESDVHIDDIVITAWNFSNEILSNIKLCLDPVNVYSVLPNSIRRLHN